MTTKRGFFNNRDTAIIAKSQGKQVSDLECHRCHNILWKGHGFFYRVKGTSRWLPFCRTDCGKLHVGKEAKFLSYDQYIAHLILSR